MALTSCSSSRPVSSPRMTAPMVSSSRLRARPSVPSANSRISLTAAPGRPVTRAMPSPTSTMRPTCSVPDLGRVVVDVPLEGGGDLVGADGQLSHRLLPFLVEFGRPPRTTRRCSFKFVEPVAGAAVHQQVADLDHHAAEQFGVDGHLEVDRVAGQAGQGLAQVPAAGCRPPRRPPAPGPPASRGPGRRPRPGHRGWPRCPGPGPRARRRRPAGGWPAAPGRRGAGRSPAGAPCTGRSRSPRAARRRRLDSTVRAKRNSWSSISSSSATVTVSNTAAA